MEIKKMEKILKVVGIIVLLVLLLVLLWWLLDYGMDKTEISECLKWQKEANKIKGYYLLEWQKEQCDYHNIQVNAPVIN